MDELHEAARAVAALLDLAAVGVEDPVAEVGRGVARLLDHQNLIAADAAVPLGDSPQLLARQGKGFLRKVENDKIVARAVHFGESQLHR